MWNHANKKLLGRAGKTMQHGPRLNESVKTCLLFFKEYLSFLWGPWEQMDFEKKIWLGWDNWVTVFQKIFLGMQFFRNINFCISELLTFFTISRTEGESGTKRIFPISRGFTALQAILVKGFDSKFWINALQNGAKDRKKDSLYVTILKSYHT